MLDDYFDLVRRLVADFGYLAVFLAMLLENTVGLGLILPGMPLVVLAGFYAGQGTLHPAAVFACAFGGTILGDNLSYGLGRFGLVKLPLLRQLAPDLHRLATSIRTDTERFLLFFHFPAYSRMILPALLGMMRYDLRRWLVLDTVGALLFSTTFIAIGFVAGRTARTVDAALDATRYIQWAFILLFGWWAISVAIAVRRLVRERRQR